MRKSAREQIDALKKELSILRNSRDGSAALEIDAEREAREFAEFRLQELAKEKLPDWLSEVLLRRGDLFDLLQEGSESGGSGYDPEPCCAWDGGGTWHRRECAWGEWLRVIGGPEETQRQVDAAHAFNSPAKSRSVSDRVFDSGVVPVAPARAPAPDFDRDFARRQAASIDPTGRSRPTTPKPRGGRR